MSHSSSPLGPRPLHVVALALKGTVRVAEAQLGPRLRSRDALERLAHSAREALFDVSLGRGGRTSLCGWDGEGGQSDALGAVAEPA